MTTSTEPVQSDPKPSRLVQFLRDVWLKAIVGALMTLGFRYLQSQISFVFNTITTFIRSSWIIVIGVPLILVIGYVLYRCKKRWQPWYGVVEITFGLATAWSGIVKLQGEHNIGAWTAVGASAYLVQRGFSNYYKER
jgi:FtsH-binding integral membrane protein